MLMTRSRGRPDTFVFGMKEQLEVDVRVVNDGEDAFEARVFVPIPRGLLYNKFVAKDNTTVVCSPRTLDSGMILVCEIGNPLPMHKGVSGCPAPPGVCVECGDGWFCGDAITDL